ncbi:MAG: type II toxin-antitoxin system VapC family toxin [Candidatus Electronema sp. V4]|uniref:type II toxin-antitoxin system VapC family toxin n=1 Tax=Candidatus Electronema sp. V4 TaxID=3454756 RepID=UPI00405540AC
MAGFLVDSCVLLDLFTNDPVWADWSENILDRCSRKDTLYINTIIYAEVSVGFNKIEEVESALGQLGVEWLEIPREALFLAGKAFLSYRKNKGTKISPLPDFFIGAHAAVFRFNLITRDVTKYRQYFPQVKLITPSSEH